MFPFVKKYLSEYVDSKGVFAIDLSISVLTSFVILLLLNFLANSSYDNVTFISVWMLSSVVGSVVAMLLYKSYKVLIRHSSLRDFVEMFNEVLMKFVIMTVPVCILNGLHRGIVVALVCDAVFTFGLLLGIRMVLIFVYDTFKAHTKDICERRRVLLYGASDKVVAAVTRLHNSNHYRVMGILSENLSSDSHKVNNVTVYSFTDEQKLKELVDNLSVSAVLFANEEDARNQAHGLIDFCIKYKLGTLIIPTVEEVAGGKLMNNKVRNIKIEDLLGREEIKISMNEIHGYFKGKTVMVTGAAGSIGSELCRQLANFDVRKIVLFDNAETPMHYVRLELEERFPNLKFVPVIGDVRSKYRLDFAFRENQPDVVFHAAAYKHVPLMEENPCEAVMVNVYGTRNVADKCVEYGVERMIMISTDKAVNPTNIMGCSKRLAEIYVQSLAAAIENGTAQGKTRFVTTRFGNVLGSNGSVIPRFREQIEKGGPVTVTHPQINRFFMTIPEACRLVMEAATMGIHNRIFVFDMGEPVKIVDLAKRMIALSGLKLGEDIEIEFTGLRPGEKLYEEVLASAEDTDSTSHDRIRIAHVREYDYADVAEAVSKLEDMAAKVLIPDMVRYMKQVVPEYKSQNSRFAEFDK